VHIRIIEDVAGEFATRKIRERKKTESQKLVDKTFVEVWSDDEERIFRIISEIAFTEQSWLSIISNKRSMAYRHKFHYFLITLLLLRRRITKK